LGVVILLTATAVYAQEPTPRELSPSELVRQVISNEVAAANSPVKHMFQSRKQLPKGSQTRLYVETTDAMAGMLIALNDQPLSPQQQQAETNHLQWLKNNPEQLRKKRAREKEDADRSMRILKAMPDAFRYEYIGTQPSEPGMGKNGDELVKLKFTSNPSYSPPTRVEQVLEGMQGYVLIDKGEMRIARIDGTLFRDVTFGWGIIGHLDKGGRFLVQQADVGENSWELTRMTLSMTGKILLFKSISFSSDETLSDFRRVPDTTNFAQAVDLLKNEQEKLARLRTPQPQQPEKTRQ
jgi:hypothetical protein